METAHVALDYKKYEKVNRRFPADPWKMTYFPEINDLGYLNSQMEQCVHPNVLQIQTYFTWY